MTITPTTTTAHAECDACDTAAKAAQTYVAAGGTRPVGRFHSSVVADGPHWAELTTRPAPTLAAATARA